MVFNVNVAVIGDEGTGKTSLVLSASQRTFRQGDSLPVLPPTAFRVKLGNEFCNCICRDTTSSNMEDVKTAIRQSDVVLICFNMNMAGNSSLQSAIHVWLPRVTQIDREMPIIMVACKEDQAVITQGQVQQLDATMNAEANLIRYDKCSARNPDTTMTVFAHACDACINPVLALYNHVREKLRSKAVRAFNRIFDMVDEDQDGALSDEEFNRFHEFCFGRPLEALNSLKQALMQRSPDAVTTQGITRSGFMHLQAMMIQQQRLDICWMMLRKLGYNKQLHLKPDLFASIQDHGLDSNTICMLSVEAVAFLTALFNRRCSDTDGLLPLDLLLADPGPKSLFHNAPPSTGSLEHPLGRSSINSLLVRGQKARKLPLESFLSIWSYCVLVDARRAVIAMLYLGYPDTYRKSRQIVGTTAADRLLVKAPRRRSQTSFTLPRPLDCGVRLFNCLLFGTKGCGKTQLLHTFAGTGAKELPTAVAAGEPLKAARFIPSQGDVPDTVLVIIEVPVESAEELSISAARDSAAQERLLSNDAMIFGFDSMQADSYMQSRALMLSMSDATNNVMPVAMLGLKADLGVSSNITSMAAKDGAELQVQMLPGLSRETEGSAEERDIATCRWASVVVDLCSNPSAHIALTPALAAKRMRSETMWRYTKYAAAAGAVVLGLVVLYQVGAHVSSAAAAQESGGRSSRDSGVSNSKLLGTLRAKPSRQ